MEESLLTQELKHKMLTLVNDYYDFNNDLVEREFNPIELSDFLELLKAVQ